MSSTVVTFLAEQGKRNSSSKRRRKSQQNLMASEDDTNEQVNHTNNIEATIPPFLPEITKTTKVPSSLKSSKTNKRRRRRRRNRMLVFSLTTTAQKKKRRMLIRPQKTPGRTWYWFWSGWFFLACGLSGNLISLVNAPLVESPHPFSSSSSTTTTQHKNGGGAAPTVASTTMETKQQQQQQGVSRSWSDWLLAQDHFYLTSLAEQSLLFWSAFDFSVDAALHYLGPVDSFLMNPASAYYYNTGSSSNSNGGKDAAGGNSGASNDNPNNINNHDNFYNYYGFDLFLTNSDEFFFDQVMLSIEEFMEPWVQNVETAVANVESMVHNVTTVVSSKVDETVQGILDHLLQLSGHKNGNSTDTAQEWFESVTQNVESFFSTMPDKIAYFLESVIWDDQGLLSDRRSTTASSVSSFLFGSSSNSSSNTADDLARQEYERKMTLIRDYRTHQQQQAPQQQQQPHNGIDAGKDEKKKKKKDKGHAQLPSFYSLYQNGDGSEDDPELIPKRFLDMHNGNRALALESLAKTIAWRQEEDIDTMLLQPHVYFDIAKAVCPHSFLGRTSDHNIVFMLQPALIDLELAAHNSLSHTGMLRHYVYVNEYLWQILEGHKPLGTMISILDLTGLQWTFLSRRDMVSLLQMFVSTMDTHFPQRAHKTLILNAPKWVNLLYQLCTPLMRESTMAKMEIHSYGPSQDEALRKYLDTDETRSNIPASFWTNPPPRKSRSNDSDSTTTETTTTKTMSKEEKEALQDDNDDPTKSKNVNTKKNKTKKTDASSVPEDTNAAASSSFSSSSASSSTTKTSTPTTDILNVNNQLEQDLRNYVLERIKEHDQEMLPVIPLSAPSRKR